MRLKSLFKLTKSHYIAFIALSLLVVFHRFSYSYVPLFTQYLIKSLYMYFDPLNQNFKDINLPNFIISFFDSAPNILQMALYVGLTLVIYQGFRFTLMYFEIHLRGKTQEKISYKLRMDLYEHIQNLSYSYHKNVDSGDLIQRVTSDVETITGFIVLQFMQLIGLLASLFSGVYQMYYVNQEIMWISLAIIPIYAVSSIIYFIKIEKIFNEVEDEESNMITVVQENINNHKVVKSFSNESYEIEKMTKQNSIYRNKKIEANKIVALYWSLMDIISMIEYALVTVLAIYFVKIGTMDGPSVVAALMLVGMLIWPIRGLGRLINEFSKAIVAIGRIDAIFNEKSEFINDGILTPEIKGKITFKDVSFKFEDDREYLLNNLSFEIKSGINVAVVGKTGSGKSTLTNILMKMYDYEGSILIDGVELKDIKKEHIRRNIGSVLQNPFLYSKTVYENISIANKIAYKDEILRASKLAALEKDIFTFRDGYDTKVGEKGTTLSGGQKQRVAIARALISKKPILIFDDALSAVDNKTDSLIREALKNDKHQSTNIIITHRITTAKDADLIIVINNKTVESIGTHDSLIKKPGLYKNLWDIQGNLEDEFKQLIEEVNLSD